MYRIPRTAAVIAAAALALTGCAGAGEQQPATTQTAQDNQAQDAPSPTRIDQPAPGESCTIALATTECAEHPDRATIECGDESRTVAGDFRHRVTNHYDPADTNGIDRVLVVGDERRVWMQRDASTCLIAWKDGEDPTDCQVPAAEESDDSLDVPIDPGTADGPSASDPSQQEV